MSMSQGFWANPPQAAAHMAIDILPMFDAPVAGLIGFVLFFATIGLFLGLFVRICRKVHDVWVSAHFARKSSRRHGRQP
jgi:hypothetical protein